MEQLYWSLRSFIGAVSYFWRFVKNFAQIMSTLYDLTKNEGINIKNWNDEQRALLIVDKLTTNPVLDKFDKLISIFKAMTSYSVL